jgi:hypothetical protein
MVSVSTPIFALVMLGGPDPCVTNVSNSEGANMVPVKNHLNAIVFPDGLVPNVINLPAMIVSMVVVMNPTNAFVMLDGKDPIVRNV